MVFTEIKPQLEQLPHDEMVKARAVLHSRLRGARPLAFSLGRLTGAQLAGPSNEGDLMLPMSETFLP